MKVGEGSKTLVGEIGSSVTTEQPAATSAPVDSSRMLSWQHLQNWRTHGEVLHRVGELLATLRAEVGEEPRRLDTSMVFDRIQDEPPRFQVYLPGWGVAGEGRCICEASLEAVYAFENILQSALDNRTWDVLPRQDRSLRTRLEVLKTDIFLGLHRFLNSRLPLDEASEASNVRSHLTAAVM